MSESKPPLKLKLTTSQRPPDVPETPSTGAPKLKLKFKPKEAPPAQDALTTLPSAPKAKVPRKSQKDKPIRTSNPTPKKRALEASTFSDDDDDLVETVSQPLKRKPTIRFISKSNNSTNGIPLAASHPTAPPSSVPNRIKLNYNRTKGAKLRTYKPLGTGYDSCASDAELDPAIEEDFILRMQPGDDCEYLRQAIVEQRFGPRSQGGADVRMVFLQSDGRRAAITIRGTLYAAAMVDLPCIIEGMKSWDKKAWYKSVDICQMLLVLGRIKSEDEALFYPLPRDVDAKTMQYAHGLTPPMHRVRTRRFRKRISRTAIEAVESQVEALLRKDEAAEEAGGTTEFAIIDENRLTEERNQRLQSEAMQDVMEFGEADAEGEEDDTQQNYDDADNGAEGDDELAKQLELAMMEGDQEEHDVPMPDSSAATPAHPVPLDSNISAPSPASAMAETPAATTPSKGATSGDDEESSDEDADSADEAEVDEDTLERQQDLQRQRAEIQELEDAIKTQQSELERQQNTIFKRKLMSKIQSLKEELELRKGAAGEVGEED